MGQMNLATLLLSPQVSLRSLKKHRRGHRMLVPAGHGVPYFLSSRKRGISSILKGPSPRRIANTSRSLQSVRKDQRGCVE